MVSIDATTLFVSCGLTSILNSPLPASSTLASKSGVEDVTFRCLTVKSFPTFTLIVFVYGFDLSAGTIADIECGCDFAFISRRHFFLLALRSGATAGSVDRFKVHRCLASILVLEMADRLFVVSC